MIDAAQFLRTVKKKKKETQKFVFRNIDRLTKFFPSKSRTSWENNNLKKLCLVISLLMFNLFIHSSN